MEIFTKYKAAILAAAFLLLVSSVGYFAYDYGKAVTVQKWQEAEIKRQAADFDLLDLLEQKNDEAYELSVKLANKKPIIEKVFRDRKVEVIKYVQKNNDARCIVDDPQWLRIRADYIRTYNQTIGIHEPAAVPHGSTVTP